MCKEGLNDTFETDHKIPIMSGGSNKPTNLQILCPECHRWKTKLERQMFTRKKNEITCRVCKCVFSPWFRHVCQKWKIFSVPKVPWARKLSEKWKK